MAFRQTSDPFGSWSFFKKFVKALALSSCWINRNMESHYFNERKGWVIKWYEWWV